MKFDDQHTFSRPKAALLKMYSDRAYFERKYREMPGVKDFEVLECESAGSKFRIKHRSMQPSDIPMPDFAKKFLGEYSHVTQQDSWDAATGLGRLDIEIRGVPIKITAEMKVTDAGTGAAHHFSWNVNCGIPLIGGKLEKIICDDIKAKSRADSLRSDQMLRDWA